MPSLAQNARAVLAALTCVGLQAWPGAWIVEADDISALNQHFNQPGKDISPWDIRAG